MSDLRLVGYLAPSLPEGLFDAVATRIAEATGRATSLRFVTRTSAPPRAESDPFSSGEADIGFLCSPGYVWMTELQIPSVRLLAAAPVFDDPRTEGRPAYFSDVIVAQGSPALRFEVDSNALALLLRREPSLASRLRILESWGPHPIQPIVASSRLPSALTDRIAASLCSMHLDERSAERLRSFGVVRFAPVADDDYASERVALRSLQGLNVTVPAAH